MTRKKFTFYLIYVHTFILLLLLFMYLRVFHELFLKTKNGDKQHKMKLLIFHARLLGSLYDTYIYIVI